ALRENVPAYCIQLPPPNVTGTLHMGHAFQQTLMDVLIRWHRMRGDNTLWQVGTDHAGIATQIVVENQLKAEGLSRRELGRDAFVERVWAWKQESGSTIAHQMRRLGSSCDWSRERFTMDAGLSNAVIEPFVRLYDDGLIYRGKRLVNWDPKLGTAVSDLEVENEEETGTLWEIRYPLADGSGDLTVATTRPETMLGDVAVAVNPDDARYAHLVGREVALPLAGRRIPVIADAYVESEFGTGAAMWPHRRSHRADAHRSMVRGHEQTRAGLASFLRRQVVQGYLLASGQWRPSEHRRASARPDPLRPRPLDNDLQPLARERLRL